MNVFFKFFIFCLFIFTFGFIPLSFSAPLRIADEIEKIKGNSQTFIRPSDRKGARIQARYLEYLHLLMNENHAQTSPPIASPFKPISLTPSVNTDLSSLTFLDISNSETCSPVPLAAPSHPPCSDLDPTPDYDFDTDYRDWILSGFNHLDFMTGLSITASSLKNFHDYVINHRSLWKEGSLVNGFALEGKSPSFGEASYKIQISLDSNRKVYLDFKQFMGHNNFQHFYKVLDFDTWDPIAGIFLKSDLDKDAKAIGMMKQEISFLKSVMELPELEQQGIAKTHGIGELAIYQNLYPNTLSILIDRNHLRSSRNRNAIKLVILKQIASGLVQIHKQGWVHTDIQPETIFVNLKPGHLPETVLTGFSLSYMPSQEIAKGVTGPYLLGTLFYRAPEIGNSRGQGTWTGASPEEILANAQKSDIYSLGVTAYGLWHSQDQSPETRKLPWLTLKQEKSESEISWLERFYQAREMKLVEFRNSLEERRNGQIDISEQISFMLDELITDCLHPDPEVRPSAVDFLNRIERISTKLRHFRRKGMDLSSPNAEGELGLQTQKAQNTAHSI